MLKILSCCLRLALLSISLGVLGAESTFAAPPWWNRLWGEGNSQTDNAKIEAAYRLSDEQGPWMIMALSFRGPTAVDDALQTAQELRKKHKLNAYMHQQSYDFSDSFVGRGVDRFGNPRRCDIN